MKKFLSFSLPACFVFAVLWGWSERQSKSSFDINELSVFSLGLGTQARKEREYKIGVVSSSQATSDSPQTVVYRLLSLIATTNQELSAEKLLKRKYSLSKAKTFIFRDIYFDTYDNKLNKHNAIYRLRYRWKQRNSFYKYIRGENIRDNKPVRVEVQAKLDRRKIAPGYSEALETRFELDGNKPPLSQLASSWHTNQLLSAMVLLAKTGRFADGFISPLVDVARQLQSVGHENKRVYLRSKKVIVSERTRYHLSMKTPWGSGNNPDHAFIVTIDKYWDFPVDKNIMRETQIAKQLLININRRDNAKTEIEIEFERNTSTELDLQIDKTLNIEKKARLIKVRNTFLADQKYIFSELQKNLLKSGFQAQPVDASKY